ncbi:MAG: 30S ribosomal protein S3 [Chloroflexi bacterium]|nr:30S ribosomal protein S3 [Chloroflexota bacterium]MCI0780887.1 30S ribosomal protein S3 [Chloroflexota bacterium]MCI0785977.1 30S ribosomal protein S3 [Chloroflexota bacterium]MCI0792471.1 30S ribosomal protein S3 [Chloroflexota bacterium]MCI0797256.1 30S ribosomal protein S3 [Chloroflexota bacterium]
MGQKTHPYGFRLGIIKDWKAHWFAPNANAYRTLVLEDLRLRERIRKEYQNFSDAGIARVEIDRGAQDSVINIHSARPGILIGRDGERVKNLRTKLEAITGRRIQLNIIEIEQPEINAYLVGRNIADQLERRVAYRRAMRQAAQRAMQGGAQGIKIIVKGRISGSEIARVEKLMLGRVPLHTLRADIDYDLAEAHTAMGQVGVKVWVYHGDILPPPPEEVEELEEIEVTVQAEDPDEMMDLQDMNGRA